MSDKREELETVIESTLAERFPEVELVDVEVHRGPSARLTVFVDRPGGVDLEVCAAVSQALDDLREEYGLEVSSPGLDRRLRKASHFAKALGSEVVVKLHEPLEGRRNFRGELTAADGASITVALEDGAGATLPIGAIARAHVVYDHETDGGHRE
jgi:ribosome maturation factor RimP